MSSYTEVFAWGGDHFGQLGLATKQTGKTYCVPRFCSFNVLIRQIACGEEHSAFIAQNGNVYTMGSNSEGRLGIGSRAVRQSAAPCLVDSLSSSPADFISCGWGHTAVVCDGMVYTWGVGEYGALGTGSVETQWFPAQMRLPIDMTAIAVSCGSRHTAILVIDSKARRRTLLMTGAGEAGQLGTGHRERELSPARVNFADDILQVSCGVFHTGFITDSGRVYTMGGNSFGQLGIGTKKSASIPTRVSGLEAVSIAKVACGHHTGAVSEQGDLYLWGTCTFGELLTPLLVSSTDAKFVDISIGGSFGAAIDSENSLWTWGSNTNGELGLGDYDQRLTPSLLVTLQGKRVKTVACGGSFCVALGGDVQPSTLLSSRTQPRKPISQSSNDFLPDRTGRKSLHIPSDRKPLSHINYEPKDDHPGEMSLSELTHTNRDKPRDIPTLRTENERFPRPGLDTRSENTEIAPLYRKIDAMHSDFERLVAENQSKTNEITALRLTNERISSEKDRLELLLHEKDASLNLSRSITEKTTYSRRETEDLLRRKDLELAAVRADLRALEGALSAKEREAAADRYKTEVFSADKLKVEGELASRNADFNQLLNELERCRAKMAQFEQSFEVSQAENARLTREIDLYRREKSDIKSEFDRLASSSDNLQRENEDLKRVLESRSVEVTSIRRDLDSAGQSRALLSSDYAKALSEVDALKQQSNELRVRLSDREADYGTLKQSYDGLARERMALQTQLARMENDYAAALISKEKLNTGLEQQLKVTSQVKLNSEENSKRLEAEIRRKEDEYFQNLTRTRENYEAKIEALTRDLRQEKEISMDLRVNGDNSENKRRDLEDKLQFERENNDKLRYEIEKLKEIGGIREEEREKLSMEVEDFRRKVKEMSVNNEELLREMERLRSQNSQLKDQISLFEEKIQAKDRENSQLFQENSLTKSAAEELKYEFEKLYQQHSDSLGEMTRVQEMNEELHEELRRTKDECEILSREIAALEAKNREIFHNFESELANKARNFRERSLSALGTPSPLKPAASPSQEGRYLQTTGRSSMLSTRPGASPEKGNTDFNRKLARAAEKMTESGGGMSPLLNLRVSSPMRKKELLESPQRSQRMDELHSFGAQEEEDLPQFAGSLRGSSTRPLDIRTRLSAIRSSKQTLVSQIEELQKELREEPPASASSEERGEDK